MYTQYTMNQTFLPLEMDSYLPENHIVYAIHQVVEDLDDAQYQLIENDFGRPAYHPKVLLKALLFAYSEGIFSGRKIEKMMQENLAMQWLTGQTLVSYRTLNRFRVSETTKGILQDLYCTFSIRLKQEKLIEGKALFIDGTKFEANANKYTFVWKKAVDRFYPRLKEKEVQYYKEEIAPLIDQAVEKDQNQVFSKEEIAALHGLIQEEIEKVELEISDATEKERVSKLKKKRRSLKKHRNRLKKDFIPREKKYEDYYNTFNGRNSFSKTDKDATFMRMKDDHMMNGQLKPGYNIQIATENQFVLHTQVYPNPTDTRTLIPFMHSLPESVQPSTFIVADAGYGSQENLAYLDQSSWTGLVKYGMYEKEQKKRFILSDKNTANWLYEEEHNTYTHPDGTVYAYSHVSKRKTATGFIRLAHIYQSTDPQYRNGRKSFSINYEYEEQKLDIREKLSSEEGIHFYGKRKIDVEPTFGQVKANLRFTQFSVRGKSKVENETNLIFMANNLWKYNKRRK
ncbi:IS1182 family transposase [Marinilactibacillus kalidii]|uniref:IS1182 family transposase n=1 Tax=Marinilactibacillus kalidii TaxID=2820274 RepID=UPI001ABE9459|nr:IS1182 family transposase [Marinilactibacillus kalidii]